MIIIKKKILAAFLVVLLLLGPLSAGQDWAGFGGAVSSQLGKRGSMSVGKVAKSLFSVSNVKTITFLLWLAWVVNSAAKHYYSHLEEYILINPNPAHPEIMRVMSFFISLTIAFYVVAIMFTGFYLLFVAGSARGRAKAKYTLGKLVIGMFFVSISPYLLQLLFQFSGSLTAAILEQGDTKMVAAEFNNALWGGYMGTAMTIFPGLMNVFAVPTGYASFTTKLGGGLVGTGMEKLAEELATGGLSKSLFLKIFGKGALSGLKFSGGAASTLALYPYFLVILLIVFTFGFLVGRYLTVMVWTILFPLSVFFVSFEPTKYIGRVMMEQTLQWTLTQVFYAITVVGLSVGLMLLPESYKGYSMFLISFQFMAVVLALFFGPWYLSSLLQKLFPP